MLKSFKQELGKLLGKGHAMFGRVAPRRDYRDEDEGGAGSAELLFETHPLLAEQPVGAASDLTAIATENSDSLDQAVERVNEASKELVKQPVLQQKLSQSHVARPAVLPVLRR